MRKAQWVFWLILHWKKNPSLGYYQKQRFSLHASSHVVDLLPMQQLHHQGEELRLGQLSLLKDALHRAEVGLTLFLMSWFMHNFILLLISHFMNILISPSLIVPKLPETTELSAISLGRLVAIS